jgi:NAD(P)-dependent dehydrogenase (short-subunit alcohol dehydrogenase family)
MNAIKKFEGRTVMITGAGKNIGKEIAMSFAAEGANIIVCDFNKENAEQTAKEIEEMGCNAMTAVCDVRDRQSIFSYVEQAIERFGKIDVLVNNAGGSAGLLRKLTRFVDAEPETLDFVLDVNIKGTMNCTQAVLKSMIANKYGKIINMSSIAAICGMYDRVDYAAAKAAQIGMVRALAMEVGEYNICVNCVSPGAIQRDGAILEHMTYLGENGHAGTPKDISETVLFLASQDYITGQNIVVDGGRTLGPGHR